MMRIRPISTSITIAMMAIVLAAPLVTNIVLAHAQEAPQQAQVQSKVEAQD
jgi:cell division protein FtsX